MREIPSGCDHYHLYAILEILRSRRGANRVMGLLPFLLPLLLCLGLQAQTPPASIAGDGFLIDINSGTPPLGTSGYFLLLPANSGNTYQAIGIYGIPDFQGTYSYGRASGSMAKIDLISSQVGRGEITVDFLTSNSGLYSFDSISFPGLNQTGEFLGATVNALGSLSGLTISCAIQDGISPFSSAGNFRFLIPSTGNRYRIQGDIGIPDSAGTYSYTLVNRSTARMRISDSLIGTADIYVGFFGSRHGGYALRTASGSFQLGEFTIPDEVPPTEVAPIVRPLGGLVKLWWLGVGKV